MDIMECRDIRGMEIMECRNIRNIRENETMKGNMEIQLLKLVVFSYIHIVIIVIAVNIAYGVDIYFKSLIGLARTCISIHEE